MKLPIEGTYILGIAEKPQAASRLAWALDDNNKPIKKRIKNVPIYICNRSKNKIVIAPAIGHLFTLEQIGRSWNYPTLDFHWIPSYTTEKSKRTKNFIEAFNLLKMQASDVIIMTDYDREGEVIGYLIIKYIMGKENAQRMKFSTLTKRDIITAFNNRDKTLNKGFLNAGLLRHYVDWLYGINFSRALSLSYKRILKGFKILSIGRVQGPTLFFIVEREREINSFIPVPFWEIESEVVLNDKKYKAKYMKNEITTLKEALEIISDCSDKIGVLSQITKNEKKLFNYPPFNLSDLQRTAYWHFKFSPSKTLKLAEKLYLRGIISYPRTDSQKLPMSLGHKKIITKLSNIERYKELANSLLSIKNFKPHEGKRTDAAHPAIHPTGNPLDQSASADEYKLYDLIVRRYLSTFAPPGKQLETKYEIKIKEHSFFVNGIKLLKEGWIKYYKPYIILNDVILPNIELNSNINFNYIKNVRKYSKPPARYNESTLLKKMEDEKIGTKATRADIITTLFQRGYIEGKIIRPTDFGIAVESVLKEQFPLITEAEMTRELENLMDSIEEKNKDLNEEILSIKRSIFISLKKFHEKEEDIGIALSEHLIRIKDNNESLVLGKCPHCNVGYLRVIKSKKTGKSFIACSAYNDPDIKCDATYPIPPGRKMEATDEVCPYDGLPLVKIIKNNKKIKICISSDCKYNIKK